MLLEDLFSRNNSPTRFLKLLSAEELKTIENRIKDNENKNLNKTLEKIQKSKEIKLKEILKRFKNSGIFFKSSLISPGDPIVHYDEEKAEDDLDRATYFFNYDIPVNMNRIDSIKGYESLEEDFIHDLFRFIDGNHYYIMSEIRDSIIHNIKILYVALYSIFFSILVLNLFYSSPYKFSELFLKSKNQKIIKGFSEQSGTIDNIIFAFISCFIGWVLISIIYYIFYKETQKNNSECLAKYATNCLTRIQSNFANINAQSKHALGIGQATPNVDLKSLGRGPKLLINLQWTTFRMFFMECFLRNIMYQILKKSSYYMAIIPLLVLGLIFFISHYFDIHFENKSFYEYFLFSIPFILLAVIQQNYMRNAIVKHIAEKINEKEMHQFHQINAISCIGETVQEWGNQVNLLIQTPPTQR